MISIGLESFKKTTNTAFLQTGFRPFFLLSTGYAVLAMLIWMGVYSFHWDLSLDGTNHLSWMLWHGHEMIYGYVMAVIAGFLLTAVRNWTKLQTADGKLLLGLVAFWIIGRIPPLNAPLAYLQAFGDLMFGSLLLLVIAVPIIERKMIRQWPVLIILSLLLVLNIAFYIDILGFSDYPLARNVVYASLYLVLNLIFIFTRRLIPNFINSALRLPKPVKNNGIIDKILIPLFLIYSLNQFWLLQQEVAVGLAAILLVLNGIRLVDWYDKGIWTKHLVWSLYVSYVFLTLGFLLRLGEYFLHYSSFLTLHMFTVGGIGMITLSMMSRVSFGHTGRNVLKELQATKWLFYGISLTVLLRVLLPIFAPQLVIHFIGTAMILWMITFSVFWVLFFKILIRKRADGMYG